MEEAKFGDSYDFIKQFILRWLRCEGEWRAHPMFSTPIKAPFPTMFSAFLGVPLVDTNPVPGKQGRHEYFKSARQCQTNLLLDPDTGLALGDIRVTKKHLELDELVDIARAEGRKSKLTLVFDQSFKRNESKENQVEGKLKYLRSKQLHCTVYKSHANFLLVSADPRALESAKRVLLLQAKVPPGRLL